MITSDYKNIIIIMITTTTGGNMKTSIFDVKAVQKKHGKKRNVTYYTVEKTGWKVCY